MAIILPGSITSIADQAKGKAFAAAEAAVPSYAEMLEKIKDGSIFKDTDAQFAALSGIPGAPDLTEAKEAVNKAKETAAVDLAVAQASLQQKAKEATAQGKELTQADVDAAMAPLGVLANAQKFIDSAVSSAKSSLSGVAAIFGAAASGSITDISSTISGFSSSLPTDGLPVDADPTKLLALESVKSSAEGIGGNLSGALSGLAEQAATAKADAIATLKADMFLSKLTKPFIPAASGILGSINTEAIDKFSAIKAQETSIKQVIPATAKPPDEVRPQSAPTTNSIEPAVEPKPQEVPAERRVFAFQVAAYGKKKDKLNVDYFKHIGRTWKPGTPYPSAQEAVDEMLTKVYDPAIGRPGANADRIVAVALRRNIPRRENQADDEREFLDKIAAERQKFNSSSWKIKFDELYAKQKQFEENYERLYNCWINKEDKFTLPKEILDEL
jgi:hypothetical protein